MATRKEQYIANHMDNMKKKLSDKNIKVLCSDLFKEWLEMEWEQDKAYHSTGYAFRAFAIDLFS